MKIIRRDMVGTIDMRLMRSPTNTAVGVDNFHVYARGYPPEAFPAPILFFLGTDPDTAHRVYEQSRKNAERAFEIVA